MAQRTHGTQGAQQASLSGVYAVTGYTGRSLSRLDGLTLTVNDTKRATLGPGDAARYVTVSAGLRSRYAGNVYAADGTATEAATADLDGCQFQDQASGVRYCIVATGEAFTVSPTTPAGGST